MTLTGNLLCLQREADSYFEVPGYGCCVASKAIGEGRVMFFGEVFMHRGMSFAMAPLYAAHAKAAHQLHEEGGVISEVACKNLAPKGSTVTLDDLRNAAHLNGKEGRVVDHKKDSTGSWRIAVQVNGSAPILCKHLNIAVPSRLR